MAKTAWGDVFDYDSGTDQAVALEDRTDFSGGKRVLADWVLTRAATFHRSSSVQPAVLVTFVPYALGAGAGMLGGRA